MQPGELRHRLEIQRLQKKKEGVFTKTDYTPIKRVWAKANGLYGSEKAETDRYEAERTVIFTIRQAACPDLTVKDRLCFRGQLYDITHIDNVLFRNEYLKITAMAAEEGERDG